MLLPETACQTIERHLYSSTSVSENETSTYLRISVDRAAEYAAQQIQKPLQILQLSSPQSGANSPQGHYWYSASNLFAAQHVSLGFCTFCSTEPVHCVQLEKICSFGCSTSCSLYTIYPPKILLHSLLKVSLMFSSIVKLLSSRKARKAQETSQHNLPWVIYAIT